MTCGLLQIEKKEEDDAMGMISFQGKKAEVCRIQGIESGPPKLVMTRLAFTRNRDYNALPYNYKNSPKIEKTSPMLLIEINRLTRSGRCFTPEELERQRKAKDKEVVNAIKGMEVNKPISEEEVDEFLKLMKYNKYNSETTEENP
jgi:hypothetical protein